MIIHFKTEKEFCEESLEKMVKLCGCQDELNTYVITSDKITEEVKYED